MAIFLPFLSSLPNVDPDTDCTDGIGIAELHEFLALLISGDGRLGGHLKGLDASPFFFLFFSSFFPFFQARLGCWIESISPTKQDPLSLGEGKDKSGPARGPNSAPFSP